MDSYLKMVAVVLVILMTGGTAAMFVISGLLPDPDAEYRVDRDYGVSGSFSGCDIEGSGRSECVNENGSFIYVLTAGYTYTSGGAVVSGESPSFSVVTNRDRQLETSLYKEAGSKDFGGETLKVWAYEGDGFAGTFVIDGRLCIREFTVTSGELALTATLKAA